MLEPHLELAMFVLRPNPSRTAATAEESAILTYDNDRPDGR